MHWSLPPRREVLRAGSLALAGITLPRLLRAEEHRARKHRAEERPGASPARADRCIVIFLNGGPSHLDMWDMKPDAPSEIRGEFKPISSSLPGVPVCELLPRLSKIMHRTTLIRSMHHSVNNAHAAAVYTALTGHDRGELGGGARPTDHPSPGAVLAKLQPEATSSIPYVALPYKTQEGAGGPLQPGFLAGFIGADYGPFWVTDDPNSADFHVPNMTLPEGVSDARVTSRRHLLANLNRPFGAVERTDSFAALDGFQQRALDLLTSSDTQRAFEIHREPDKSRDAYGRNIYGQSVLLSRRLIEAGTRVVTVSWAPDANATWDTHGNNFKKLRGSLLPQFDAAFSSLMSDLDQRGLLERTLVAVLGDFGRTPRINKSAGRDHWNSCYTVMLAGGGIKEGYVLGASDRIGAVPDRDGVSPGDVLATIYSILGIDPHEMLPDQLGRPQPLIPHGRVLPQILA
jgi:hypothetical protein